MKKTSHWRWRPKKLMVLAAIISLIPLPVLAGEGNPPTSATTNLRASADRAVSREIEKLTNDVRGTTRHTVPVATPGAAFNDRAGATPRSEQGTTPENRSAQFFKTGVGITVIAVFAAGVGYALYSAQHDRVHSAGKQ